MPNNDTRNVKLGVCRVIFDGVDLGLTKGGVEVEVATETYKVEVDQFGKSTINELIMGRTVSAKVPLAETTLDNMVAIMPGAALVQTGGVKASGTITISTNPVANDTVVVNGVTLKFVASNPGVNQVLIGADVSATAANLQAVLAAHTDPRVSNANYAVAAGVITVTFDSYGVDGNSFTLAKTGSGVTVSGPKLTGGVDSSSATVTVPTGIGIDLLSVAKRLVLHPMSKADGDKSDDFVIPKAATAGQMQFAYKLDAERIFNVTFAGYPDSLTSTLFWVGPDPV